MNELSFKNENIKSTKIYDDNDIMNEINELGFKRANTMNMNKNANTMNMNKNANTMNELSFIDTGYEIYLKFNKFNNEHLDKLTEIYNDIDIEITNYPTRITLSELETEQVISTFKNIKPSNEILDNYLKNYSKNIIGEFEQESELIEVFVHNLNNDIIDYLDYKKQNVELNNKINNIEKKYSNIEKKYSNIENKIDNSSKKNTQFGRPKQFGQDTDTTDTTDIDTSTFAKFLSQPQPIKQFDVTPLESTEFANFRNFSTISESCNFKSFDTIKKSFTLLYIKYFNTTIVYNDTYNYSSLCENFPEILCFPNVTSDVQKIFHKRTFNSYSNFKETLETINTSVSIEIPNNIEEYIESFIKSNYTISQDIKSRTKSSDLLENIQRELYNKNFNVKINIKWFSQFLVKIGLKRKRFTDGYYYYGITLFDKDPEDLLQKIIRDRNNLELEFPKKSQI